MAQAAYPIAVQSSPDGVTFTSVPGLSSAQVPPKNEILEATALGGGGAKARIYGKSAWTAKLSGDYVNGNVGQTNFLFNEGNRCDLKVYYSDATWLQFQGIVEGYDIDLNESGKVTWSATINANALPTSNAAGTLPTDTPAAAAIAGYSGVIQLPGTSTPLAAEAMSLVSGNTYQITNAAHRLLDPTVTPTFKANGVAVPANQIQVIDYMFGKVTFTGAQTAPITMDTGSYLPLVSIAETKSFKVSVKNLLLDKTSGDSGGVKTFAKGLKDASGSFLTLTPLTSVYTGTSKLTDAILNRTPLLIAHNLGIGNTGRFWALIGGDVKHSPAALTENTVNWQSTARAIGRDEASFAWGS